MRIVYILIVITLILFSCKRKDRWNHEAFYEQTFKLIEENSIKKNEVNWIALKQTVKDSIKQFTTNKQVYNAIGYTVKLIDDGHSVFAAAQTPKGGITNRLLIDTLSVPIIDAKILNNIGYIKLPGYIATDSLINQYALEIRKTLLKLDSSDNLTGWIVDLRENSGGKLSSEPLGLLPLFEKPLIGISCNNKEVFKGITCSNNFVYFGQSKIDSLIYKSTLKNKNKRIAVLISKNTVSAGEFLALAFRFQDKTKFFGSKTKGKTSHLRLFQFKSNAKLLLATHYYCNKDSIKIRSGILPDVECDTEESLAKAIEWLTNPI